MTDLQDFENELRAMLADQEHAAAEPDGLADRLITNASKRQGTVHRVDFSRRATKRWLPPLFVAAAVALAVALTSILVSATRADKHTPATPSPSSTVHPTHTSAPGPSGLPTDKSVELVTPAPATDLGKVPWQDVAAGWTMAEVKDGGTVKLRLFSPTGAGYDVADLKKNVHWQWLQDPQRAVFGTDTATQVLDLTTGATVTSAKRKWDLDTIAPDGTHAVKLGSNAQGGGSGMFTLDGKPVVQYPASANYSGPAQTTIESGGMLFTSGGDSFMTTRGESFAVVGIGGQLLHSMPFPKGASYCQLLSWWSADQNRAAAVCDQKTLWIVPTDGGAVSALGADLSAEYTDTWGVGSATYAITWPVCADPPPAKIDSRYWGHVDTLEGANWRTVDSPSVAGKQFHEALGRGGDYVLLNAADGSGYCGDVSGTGELYTWNISTGQTQKLVSYETGAIGYKPGDGTAQMFHGAAPTTSTPTSTATTTAAGTSSGVPRSQVPWDQVGDGWVLAGAAGRRYLIAPSGTRYDVGADTGNGAPWSPDGRRVVEDGPQLKVTDLATGHSTNIGKPHDRFVAFTRPTGTAFVVVDYHGTGPLRKYGADGTLDVTYPESADGIGRIGGPEGTTNIQVLYTPDGGRLVVSAEHGMAVLTNSGDVVRSLPVPDGATGTCTPLSWWTDGSLVAGCGGGAWRFDLDSGHATRLAGMNPDAGFVNGTYSDVWRSVGGMSYGLPGPGGGPLDLVQLDAAGVPHAVTLPAPSGVQNAKVRAVTGNAGSLVLIEASQNGCACDDPIRALYTWNLDTHELRTYLGPDAGTQWAALYRGPNR